MKNRFIVGSSFEFSYRELDLEVGDWFIFFYIWFGIYVLNFMVLIGAWIVCVGYWHLFSSWSYVATIH